MNTRGRALREQQAAAPATASSSPDISAKSKHTLGSESATLAASASTYHEGEEGGEGETPSFVTAAFSSVLPPEPEEPEEDISPLEDRLPLIGDVVNALRRDYHVLQILDTPGVFKSPDAKAEFIATYFSHTPGSEDFWEEAWEHMHGAIFMNLPTTQNQVKKCKDEYIYDINFILNEHFASLLPEKYWGLPFDEKTKLLCLCKRIGFVFVDIFESMITMPRGKKVIPIETQLQACLDTLATKILDDYFEDGVDKHVYYVAGYLCHAGQKGSLKRRGELGELLASMSVHFTSTASELDALKASLPSGVTNLVDTRAVHGLLTYPDRPFYSFIARIEYCYAELATPANLLVFGGGVLAMICEAILAHELFQEHFISLLGDGVSFNYETVQEAMDFYVKVFSNLRLKDLCRKYNSRLSKTNTVGIRQSLAANRKSKKIEVKAREREPEPDEEESTEQELHLELESIADRGLDDESAMALDDGDGGEADSTSTNGE